MIEIKNLGRMPYGEALKIQQELFDKLVESKTHNLSLITHNYILFVEHPAVYTLGKSGRDANLLVDQEWLRERGAEFYRTERGGDITFHGIGQQVVYPIVDVEQLRITNYELRITSSELGIKDSELRGLKAYIYILEEAVIRTIAKWGIKGTRVEGASGVWIDEQSEISNQQLAGCGQQKLRKICAIGVRSSHWVTMHGLALNVNTDLKWFDYINPCGFTDRGVTSMARELGEEVEMEEVRGELERNLLELLDLDCGLNPQ